MFIANFAMNFTYTEIEATAMFMQHYMKLSPSDLKPTENFLIVFD